MSNLTRDPESSILNPQPFPQTDAAVIERLSKYSPNTSKAAIGMYQCRRELGKTVMEAYILVLNDISKAMGIQGAIFEEGRDKPDAE